MCGIAGVLRPAGFDVESMQRVLDDMTDRLRHRGPDDRGTWLDGARGVALGFRRLAIQDLSAAGAQPMASPAGRYVMVFNGEVYNFKEIRSELGGHGVAFRGRSDTEVILAAFDRWGIEDALTRFNGMFAMAIWDRETGSTTLVRDRLGIKPLYVHCGVRDVTFASELKALMAHPGFCGEFDSCGVLAYLGALYAPAPRTVFRNVTKIPPGHRLVVGGDGAVGEPVPYWDIRDVARSADPFEGSDAEALGELDALLEASVELRLRADVPVGALLSGGVDSSTVVAYMARLRGGDGVRTYSIGFDDAEHDESEHAAAVAAHLGTRHRALHVTGKDALDVVPLLPDMFDEPLADPSQIPTYLVSQLAREEVTVALSGDGGDELFGGYNRYIHGPAWIDRVGRIPARVRRPLGRALGRVPSRQWERLRPVLPGGRSQRLFGEKVAKIARLMQGDSAESMYGSLLAVNDSPARLLRAEVGNGAPEREDGTLTLSQMLLSDQRAYLPDDLLAKVDRSSMAVSLEVRVPLLDHRIVEFAWRLPDAMKIRNDEGKWLLRQLLYRHVPRALLDRPKTGFTVPVSKWLRGPLREWAHSLIEANARSGSSPIHGAAAQELWSGFCRGREQDALAVWAIVQFLAWLERQGMGN